MTRVTFSFPDVTLLQEMLAIDGAKSTDLDKDGKGRCAIKVSGFGYTVDFRKRTVSTSWWQKIKNFFASHCGNRQKLKTSDLKELIFAPGKHFTEPDVAKWVFKNQLEREGVAIPMPAYDWLGEAKPPRGSLSSFKHLGEGFFATVESVVWGPKAGPLMVKKTAKCEEDVPELMNEEQLLAQLNHPNIVRSYPGVAPEGSMLMNDGGVQLFDACLANLNQEPRDVLLSCCRQLLSAIAYLSERNIVHRDIKLENILINPNTKQIQLADFGLARDLGPIGTDDECVGSAEYMAPEVFFGYPYRTAPDVYSAGCTIFGLLCNEMLRDDVQVEEGIYPSGEELTALLTESLQSVREQFDPEDMTRLVDVLGAMLDPNPATRITAEEALEIFASFDMDT